MHLLAVLLLSHVALGAEFFNCPKDESTGKFADPDQCDKYWDCFRGEATAEYCPDGLAFSSKFRRNSNPCVYTWRADCDDRLGPANGTAPCVRENGVYAHEDPNDCTRYYVCTNNKAEEYVCPAGLNYNLYTYNCDWPEVADRGVCDTKNSVRGFTCPDEIVFNGNGLREAHPRYNDLDDCRNFFVCLNGVTPQASKCPLGEVFSERTSTCTLAERVAGCENYYQNHPLRSQFVDLNGDGRVDKLKAAFRQ